MKRLIRKAETLLDVQVGDDVHLGDDSKYEGLTINDLSKPEHRDGAVLIDSKANTIHWGLSGETHADLQEKHYGISQGDGGQWVLEIDDYVTPGIYLKDFLGHPAIILYNDNIPNVESVIVSNEPGIRVYVDMWEIDEVQRLANKNKKIKRVG